MVYQAARKAVERQTAAAHERQKVSFNPTVKTTKVKAGPSAVQTIPHESKGKSVRQSTRQSAVQNRGETNQKLQQHEQKKVCTLRYDGHHA